MHMLVLGVIMIGWTALIFADATVEQVLSSKIVHLRDVRSMPLAVGDVLMTYRPVELTGMTAETARVKVISVEGNDALALLMEDETEESRALFKKFPGVMAGDAARLPALVVTQTQQALPELNFSFRDLFEDPKASPVNFDLDEKGLAVLEEKMAPFIGAKVSRIFVEAYVDEKQPRSVALLESQLRAKAVRQVLIDSYKVEPSRIVAIGFGEMEPALDRLVPHTTDQDRRLIIRFSSEE